MQATTETTSSNDVPGRVTRIRATVTRTALARTAMARAALGLAILALLLPTAGPLLAQDQGDAPTPDLQEIFGETIDVRVINVEVVVTDKDGNPVLGLQPEDFELVVEGEGTPIDYFTEIRGGVAVEPEEGEQPGPGGLPSVAPGEPVPTSYLLFIDDYFSIARDRNQVLDNLMDQLPLLGPRDRMAVVAFDGGTIDMLSTWSQSTSDLRRALQDAKFRTARGLTRFGELRFFETVNDFEDTFRRSPFDLGFQERQYAQELAQQVSRSVTAAASTLRGFGQPPGRKVMMLLAGGWPWNPGQYAADDPGLPVTDPTVPRGEEIFEPLVRTANLLGFTIYPVDVPGLDTDLRSDASRRLGDARSQGELAFRETLSEESLQFVADETGGRALLDGARLSAFERTVQDTRTYYWLGFDSERTGDDQERKIRVEVKGQGLKVRSRDSYRDLSRQQEVDLAVESALLFGAPPGFDNLPLGVGEAERSGRRFLMLPLQVAIPVEAVTLVPYEGRYVGRVELRIAAVSEKGDQSDIPMVPLDLTLEEEPQPEQYIPYQTTIRLRNQHQRLIVALYDLLGNNLQTNTLDLEPVGKKK